MKKLLLSFLLVISPVCFVNQPVDKIALQAIKNGLSVGLNNVENVMTVLLKQLEQERCDYTLPLQMAKEFCKGGAFREQIKNVRDVISSSIKGSISEKQNNVTTDFGDVFETIFYLSEKAALEYFSNHDETSLMQRHVFSTYCTYYFLKTTLTNVIKDIEAHIDQDIELVLQLS